MGGAVKNKRTHQQNIARVGARIYDRSGGSTVGAGADGGTRTLAFHGNCAVEADTWNIGSDFIFPHVKKVGGL